MGKLITITSQKGGVGKTTLVVNIAAMFAKKGKKVAIIDFDPQKNLKDWFTVREKDNIDLFELTLKDFVENKENLKTTYDFIFIDTPPTANKEVEKVVAASDYSIIPVKASPNDLRALIGTLNMLKRAGVPRERFSFVINENRGTVLLNEAIGSLSDYSKISAIIPSKLVFQEVMISGSTVVESKPYDTVIKEFSKIYKDILDRS